MTRLTPTLLLFVVFAWNAHALTCGTRSCPSNNACCNDVSMGMTCYDPGQATCTSTGQVSASGSPTYRLCGYNEGACGTVCYQTANYFCCNGQLKQKGQACGSAPTTSAPATSTQSTVAPIPQNNCPAAANQPGVNCSSPSLCCGYGTMTPSCLPADGSKKCCSWYLSATQCAPDAVCGGGLGPGASSYAMCGAPNTTFCQHGFGSNTFCTAAQPTCCGLSDSYSFCCAPGCTCNNTQYTCNCPNSATSAPTTVTRATPVPTTVAPTTVAQTTAAPPRNNCPGAANSAGVNCSDPSLCCGAGTMTPSCLPADGSKQCCTWYLSSTQCNPNQVCGGSYGYGASSYAQCGPPGTTFCNKGDGSNAFCSASQPLCCGNYGQLGFCCASNCTCNNTQLTCNC